MNISELFIRRPVMTVLLSLAILCAGIAGLFLLPQSSMPNVDFPTIQVSASLTGASAETMASSVATPLEKEFSTIAGLDSMSSSSSMGRTRISLQFNLSRNIDTAAQDVEAAISKAARQLPPDMQAPPSYQKVNPAAQPVLFLALTSDTLPLSELDYYASTYLSQRISMISGVAQVDINGSQKYAVRVKLDPRALAARSIGIAEVIAAIKEGNANLPTGVIDGAARSFTIQSRGQLETAAAYRSLIVAYRNGSPVRLEDLGRVVDSVENDKTAAWYGNTRAIFLAIQRQPGTNTVAVVNRIKALLPGLKEQLPTSVRLEIFHDMSEPIRESVRDVQLTLGIAIALVMMVIFLFLRKLSATVIPGLALLMSVVGTFAVMYFLGFSLDILSLMALTLSVGFVVDDAIVMLENIVRHEERGEHPRQAALKGSREIGFTIISMTLSLVVVFIPVLFMGGVLGRILNEFAVTISAAILISGFVSLSLTPMLCSRFLRVGHTGRENRLFRALESFFAGLVRGYERSLNAALRHRSVTIGAGVIIMAVTVYLFFIIPKGFIPNDDMNRIVGSTEGMQGISFESMKQHQQALAEIIGRDKNVESVLSSVGNGGINAGYLVARLKPANRRRLNADQVIEQMRPRTASLPGIRIFLQNPPTIPLGSRSSRSPYQFTLQSPDTTLLFAQAEAFEGRLRDLDLIQDLSSDLQIKNPQVEVVTDRNRASALGVSPLQVEDALFSAFGARTVSTIFAPDNQYPVIVELDDRYQADPAGIGMLRIRTGGDRVVPLGVVAQLTENVGPSSINHTGQLPSVTFSFGLKPRASLGEATAAIRELADTHLPPGITTSFQGSAQAFQDSLGGLVPLFLGAILVIYIVLGILYEDFIHPVTILSGLPSAAFGALLTLVLFGKQLDLYAIVGILMLIGIVKKNAIMMIDFAVESMRKEGKDAREAIVGGCLIRFRPILMTSIAAFMGALPIAIGFGADAVSRRPLGLAVTGGLLFSQMFTLYLTPVFFLYMEDFKRLIRRRSGHAGSQQPSDLPAETGRGKKTG